MTGEAVLKGGVGFFSCEEPFDSNIRTAKPQGEWFHIDTHLPPLAYSITRYKVFSVSITSNSLTGGGEKKTGDRVRGLEKGKGKSGLLGGAVRARVKPKKKANKSRGIIITWLECMTLNVKLCLFLSLSDNREETHVSV